MCALLSLVVPACSLPWSGEGASQTNVAFQLRDNVVTVDGKVGPREARIALSTAAPRTLLDQSFSDAAPRPRLTLSPRLMYEPQRVAVVNLQPLGDALLGREAWESRVLTFDYYRNLLTIGRAVANAPDFVWFSFVGGDPLVPVSIDGVTKLALIETALPDTLIVPASEYGREGKVRSRQMRVAVSGIDFGVVDARTGEGDVVVIGNRLLARFVVVVDYRNERVGLWRDPRWREAS